MKKVILIEDDVFLLKTYEVKLGAEGFLPIPVGDSITAIQKVKAEKPDIIVTDLIMPGKNGFEIIKEIRKDPELIGIPLIVLTVLDEQKDIDKCIELGANEVIIKSFATFKDVLDKVNAYILKD